MTFHTTTLIDIYRGATTDSYGDEVDTDTPVHTGVPASIIEQTKTIRNQDSRTPEKIRTYTGRLYAGVDIRDDDRIRDRATGRYYIVDGIQQLTNPAMTPTVKVDLRTNNV